MFPTSVASSKDGFTFSSYNCEAAFTNDDSNSLSNIVSSSVVFLLQQQVTRKEKQVKLVLIMAKVLNHR